MTRLSPMPLSVSLWQLCLIYLKIGVTGLGPIFLVDTHKQLVKNLRWIREEDFINGLALAQFLPGATYVSLTVYIGFKLRGVKGALISFFAFLFPSFCIMLLLSAAYFTFGSQPKVNVVYTGVTVVMAGLLPYTSLKMARSAIIDWRSTIIFLGGFCSTIYDSNVLALLLMGACAGCVLNAFSGSRQITACRRLPHDDDRKTYKKYALLLLPAAVVVALISWIFIGKFDPRLQPLVYVFSRMGALLFGGGSAMIPFMQQEVVTHYHWLSMKEFLVGITLGQITPGPFLITATFVGYKVASLRGALAATLSIFLPSLFFVMAAAGIHEQIQHHYWVKSAIRGIVAAFAGMLWVVAAGLVKHAIADVSSGVIALVVFFAMLSGKFQTLYVIIMGAATYWLWTILSNGQV